MSLTPEALETFRKASHAAIDQMVDSMGDSVQHADSLLQIAALVQMAMDASKTVNYATFVVQALGRMPYDVEITLRPLVPGKLTQQQKLVAAEEEIARLKEKLAAYEGEDGPELGQASWEQCGG